MSLLQTRQGIEGLIDRKAHHLGQRERAAERVCPMHRRRLGGIARAAAIGARHLDIGEELNVEGDGSRAFARRATQLSGVVREIPRLQPGRTRFCRARVRTAKLIMNAGVCRHRRAHVGADGRGVDQLDLPHSPGIDHSHVRRQRSVRRTRLQGGDDSLEHERGFARTPTPPLRPQDDLGVSRTSRGLTV